MPSMNVASDAVDALGAVAQAISQGAITPAEGAALAHIVHAYSRAIETSDLIDELDDIKESLRRSEHGGQA